MVNSGKGRRPGAVGSPVNTQKGSKHFFSKEGNKRRRAATAKRHAERRKAIIEEIFKAVDELGKDFSGLEPDQRRSRNSIAMALTRSRRVTLLADHYALVKVMLKLQRQRKLKLPSIDPRRRGRKKTLKKNGKKS